jgi:uncharacterized protein YjiS (DUF1127 family)
MEAVMRSIVDGSWNRIVTVQFAPKRSRRFGWIAALADAWIERYRQRRALLELSDHMLKDIGISRVEAWREGRKPFWRA